MTNNITIGLMQNNNLTLVNNNHPKRCLKASSTLATSIICILNLSILMPLMLFFGTNIDLKPSFSASPMRWSMRVTWRISPERPTSPAMHTCFLIAISTLLDKMAHITAKSRAGSLTFSPPAMLRNTSTRSCRNACAMRAAYSFASNQIL